MNARASYLSFFLVLALGAVAHAGIEPAAAVEPDTGVSDATAVASTPELDAVSFEVPAIAVSCRDALAASETPGSPQDDATVEARGGKGCKPCKKDRRWCECTLDGMPRVSCDPCCYQETPFSTPVCLD